MSLDGADQFRTRISRAKITYTSQPIRNLVCCHYLTDPHRMRIPLASLRSLNTRPLQAPARSNFAKIGSYISTPGSRSLSAANMPADVKNEVDGLIHDNFVMVFSKSYCPYCSATKKLLDSVKLESGKTYKVIELDQRDDGSTIQSYLEQRNGQRTVPQVFINEVSAFTRIWVLPAARAHAALNSSRSGIHWRQLGPPGAQGLQARREAQGAEEELKEFRCR